MPQQRAIQLPYARPVVALLIVGVLLYFAGSWLFSIFGFGISQRASAALVPEQRGTVQVSLEGGDWKRADQELKIFPGDSVQTGSNAGAAMTFFDGSYVRMDSETTVAVEESAHGEDDSEITLELQNGTLWVAVPARNAFTGAITREVVTPLFSAVLPTQTEALISGQNLIVYEADGPGVTVTVAGSRKTVIVGEGQALTLPENPADAEDLYAFRSAIDPRAMATPFIEQSRALYGSHWKPGTPAPVATGTGTAPAPLPGGSLLMVSVPKNGAVVVESTVDVEGSVDLTSVSNVRVNGYAAQLNSRTGVFTIELALSDDEEIVITVEAISRDGIVVEEQSVRVVRNLEPPPPPAFTAPATNGQTYQTQSTKLRIEGTAPAGTAGIIVNDYRLQLFKLGDTTWSYLANADLDNFQEGENIFTAVALDQTGRRSEPVTMTVILGGATEGVVGGSTGTGAAASSVPTVDPSTLPQNDPLQPGTIQVTAPTAGSEHVAAGTGETEFLIEGLVPAGTASVWVNDYKLQLFASGKTYWNYIASTTLNTMKRGRNTYEVVARNAENQILDKFTYVIEFTP
jgi:hypothetical protein